MLVGRRQIRTLPKAGEIIGTLRRLESRGHTRFDKAPCGAALRATIRTSDFGVYRVIRLLRVCMKTSSRRFLFAAYQVAILFAITSEAKAADSGGMFLCRSPVFAGTFYGNLLTAQQTGVELNKKIAEDIAKKNECKFVPSDKLKPIDFVAGELMPLLTAKSKDGQTLTCILPTLIALQIERLFKGYFWGYVGSSNRKLLWCFKMILQQCDYDPGHHLLGRQRPLYRMKLTLTADFRVIRSRRWPLRFVDIRPNFGV